MWTSKSRRRFPTREPVTIREASRTFSASSHAATSSSTRAPTSSACSRAWRGSRSSARMSPMPALRLAACAVGARRHVSAGCGLAREPRTIRALRARAQRSPRAVAGARRGRDDPRHHHAPVLEHDREAAGCAPFERKHLGRLGSVAAGSKAGAIQADLGALLSAARTGDEQRSSSRRVSCVDA